MQTILNHTNQVINRISVIITRLIKNDILFTDLDQNEMIKLVTNLINQYLSNEEIDSISDDILTKRIRKILAIEVMSHLFDDLSNEQIKMFDESVART